MHIRGLGYDEIVKLMQIYEMATRLELSGLKQDSLEKLQNMDKLATMYLTESAAELQREAERHLAEALSKAKEPA